MARQAVVERRTRETDIAVTLELDRLHIIMQPVTEFLVNLLTVSTWACNTADTMHSTAIEIKHTLPFLFTAQDTRIGIFGTVDVHMVFSVAAEWTLYIKCVCVDRVLRVNFQPKQVDNLADVDLSGRTHL